MTKTVCLIPVSQEEVSKIILWLKDSSAGWDNIYSKTMKQTYQHILPMLTHLFNLSITKGIVPKESKIGKVVPIYKNENCMLVNNFRLVSVLPLFSKILERLMYSRILSFLKKYQFGFRERHGTDIALIALIDKIMSVLNEGDYVLGVFLDLSKAFDTVDHNILLMKLYKYGIRGVAYDWIKNYLEERMQYLSFNKHASSTMDIKCGVPQGSILGQLLFLIYVNDLSSVSSILFTLLFANDTNVFVTGKNLSTLFTTMNSELFKLSEWMNINKLSHNVKKTNYMLFCTKNPSVILNDIALNCEIIEKVEHFKFLGVHIDSKLNWSYHIQCIRKKLCKGIGILYRAKDYLKYDTLLTLYDSFIYPYIMYCIEVWGSTTKGNLVSLLKLQKRVLCIIKSVPTRTTLDNRNGSWRIELLRKGFWGRGTVPGCGVTVYLMLCVSAYTYI